MSSTDNSDISECQKHMAKEIFGACPSKEYPASHYTEDENDELVDVRNRLRDRLDHLDGGVPAALVENRERLVEKLVAFGTGENPLGYTQVLKRVTDTMADHDWWGRRCRRTPLETDLPVRITGLFFDLLKDAARSPRCEHEWHWRATGAGMGHYCKKCDAFKPYSPNDKDHGTA